ncbi:PIG-L family deacetylase [Streptomyces chengbuensis]|uniref:PIG-L deacetylase family protein n=1 Tax=Streptomyces chengbuensis TaxID=3053466 RepID=UPI0025B37D1E|nr:PIG-L family deacetylase [Streptomyces sp. HUAS CB01]WJY48667.1 PIG-L family deacetylase [Streptomyces sp. HUAS CB01]
MTRIESARDVVGLGTVLGVWAHPDDEAYLSGGLMALARDRGSRVVCVTATRGELGTEQPEVWPPDRLAAARTYELAQCLAVLGVHEHHWLGYRDGQCAAVPRSRAVGRLGDIIACVRPDTVLTFGPDGITGHPDHRTVSDWTTAAFARAAPDGARLLHATFAERRGPRWAALNERLGIFPPGLPVLTPDRLLAVDVVLDARTADRKVRALAAQRTQTAELMALLGLERFTAWVGDESFVDATDTSRAVDAVRAAAARAAPDGDAGEARTEGNARTATAASTSR